MKQFLLAAACIVALAGCSKSATGGYGNTETGTGLSAETAATTNDSVASSSYRSSSPEMSKRYSTNTGAPFAPGTLTTKQGLAERVTPTAPGTDIKTDNSGTALTGSATGTTGAGVTPNTAQNAGALSSSGDTAATGTAESPLDRSLASSVQSALTSADQGAALSASDAVNVHVSAQQGVVTLTGSVKSATQKQALTDKIQKMNGVTIVQNNLSVNDQTAQGSAAQNQTESNSSQQK